MKKHDARLEIRLPVHVKKLALKNAKAAKLNVSEYLRILIVSD